MRNAIDCLETQLKKMIADNLKRIMKQKGFSQAKLSEQSGIPQSTLSDIIQEKFLLSAGKVQQICDALNVQKSDIDPSFKSNPKKFVNEEDYADFMIKLYSQPLHLDMIEYIQELYFEDKLLTQDEKVKIKNMVRLLLNN